MGYDGRWETAKAEVSAGIAWVELAAPDKRNAMSLTRDSEMSEVLKALDADDQVGVLVLSSAGEGFSADVDPDECFRELGEAPAQIQRRARRGSNYSQWRILRDYPKPTLAMVDGWCFGDAFTPLVACDLAAAADEAMFGLSEITWGIPPGSVVIRMLAETVGTRDALLYILTGRAFDGRKAAELGLVNWSTPRERLRGEVEALARELLAKNPDALSVAKQDFKNCQEMGREVADDYR